MIHEIQTQKQQNCCLKPSENNLDSQDLRGQTPKEQKYHKISWKRHLLIL